MHNSSSFFVVHQNTFYSVQHTNSLIIAATHVWSTLSTFLLDSFLSFFLIFSVATSSLHLGHVSEWRHALLNLCISVDRHVSGWRHVATCTFPLLYTDSVPTCLWMEACCYLHIVVLCTDSMSLDGGTLSTYASLVVWTVITLDGGMLSTCTFPESQYGSIQHPVHVLKWGDWIDRFLIFLQELNTQPHSRGS